MIKKSIDKSIRNSFFDFISNRSSAVEFLKNIEIESNLILFGGALREYFESGFEKKPRDIDIVVTSMDKNNIVYFLEKYSSGYKINKFGGYKALFDDLKFDIWKIESTWAFKKNKVDFQYHSDLNKTVFLNIDAISYNLSTQELHESGFFEAKKNKQLDIILEENPYPELNIMRAFVFKNKYDLSFSGNLISYLHNWFYKQEKTSDFSEVITTLKELEIKRYGENKVNWFKEAYGILGY